MVDANCLHLKLIRFFVLLISEQQEEVHDAADDDAISMDQQSFRSVSTFDLPSPALSLRDAEKAEKMSWVWQWAEKRVDAAGGTRIYCLVPRCTQKKGWASMRGSTDNIRNHLQSDHKLNEQSKAVDTGQQGQPGPIENVLATQGKRTSSHFSTDALERQVYKYLSAISCPTCLCNRLWCRSYLRLRIQHHLRKT